MCKKPSNRKTLLKSMLSLPFVEWINPVCIQKRKLDEKKEEIRCRNGFQKKSLWIQGVSYTFERVQLNSQRWEIVSLLLFSNRIQIGNTTPFLFIKFSFDTFDSFRWKSNPTNGVRSQLTESISLVRENEDAIQF